MLEFSIFGILAGLLLLSSSMVVFSREIMRSILWLVVSFVSAAALWILLNAEFLGLLLILVYVGAVLTLFLFVTMTLPISPFYAPSEPYINRYILSFAVALVGLGCILYGLHSEIMLTAFQKSTSSQVKLVTQQENTKALGMQLYTDFIYPFELAGILLLVAIIVSISLHNDSHIPDANHEQKNLLQKNQVHTQPNERVKLVQGD